MRITKFFLMGAFVGLLMPMPSHAQSRKKRQPVSTVSAAKVATKVQWEITPMNCQVIIDEGKQKFAVTNGKLTATLQDGAHSYEVVSEGYHTFKGKINTNRRQEINLSVNLRRSNMGGIDIAAFPDGVDILYGDKRCQTYLSLDSLAEGSHQFSFSKEGYMPIDTTFSVKDGVTSYYSVYLRPKQVVNLLAETGKKDKKQKQSHQQRENSNHEGASKKYPSAFLAMAQVGYSNALSYGVMLGYVKANGFYVKGMSSFGSGTASYVSNKAGVITGSNGEALSPYYTTDVKHQNFALSGGYLRRLGKPVLCYVGAGYGQQKILWTTIDNQMVENQDLSKKGVAAEGGLILTLGKFAISCGVQTINFATGEVQFGVGLAI